MENLLTVEEVAPLLKIEAQAVYRFAREGHLPHVKIGERKIRFSRAALEAWAEAQLAATGKGKAEASVPAK